jgi:ferritin
MLPKEIESALNDQINAELRSAYLYLSMVAYFDSINLAGFARWMKLQAQEETAHAMRFYDFINDRRGRVLLQPIAEVATQWDSPLAAFEAAFKHEQYITGRINDLGDLARKHKDHAAENFLQWFVKEQVEEEAAADAVVQKLKLIADAPHGLFMLDQQMAQRGGD